MDPEDKCRELEAQISELQQARDTAGTQAAKRDLQDQIDALRNMVDGIRIGVADALGAKVDRILEEIRTEHNLDAVSALTRTVEGLREIKPQL
jgi:hypothetical protein